MDRQEQELSITISDESKLARHYERPMHTKTRGTHRVVGVAISREHVLHTSCFFLDTHQDMHDDTSDNVFYGHGGASVKHDLIKKCFISASTTS